MTQDTCNAGRQAGARIWAAIHAKATGTCGCIGNELGVSRERGPGAPGTSRVLIGDYGSLHPSCSWRRHCFALADGKQRGRRAVTRA